jgi:ribosomal protein S18 acetylase RimI-like enzyme
VARNLRQSHLRRFNARTLAEHLARFPGMAFAAPDGREYVVAGPWRQRSEVAELIEASRGPTWPALLDALTDSLAAQGVRLLVLDYSLEAADRDFYQRSGFQLVERIVEYERSDTRPEMRTGLVRPSGLRVRGYRPADRDQVLEVERESFPWLWWNSEEEWDTYTRSPAVEVLLGCWDDRVVGYVSFTVHRHDAHLDRLAVRQPFEGHGFGATLLAASLQRMAERAARRVALTTQEDNLRSQALYERFRFVRGRWSYEIQGRWLDRPEDKAL